MIKRIILVSAIMLTMISCENSFPTWEEFNTLWLEENKVKLGSSSEVDSVFVLPTGVQCEVMHRGYGPIPKPTIDPSTGKSSLLEVKYTGSLPDGVVFEQTDSVFAKIYLGDCIPGWQDALSVMPQGSHVKLYIPAEEGYGEDGVKDPYQNFLIPPHSTLIFDIEIIDVINF